MDTHKLSRSQLNSLKCDYMYEVHDETVMDASDMVTDEQIHEYYAGTYFVPGDFGDDYGNDVLESESGREVHDGYRIEKSDIFDGLTLVVDMDDMFVTLNLRENRWPEARDIACELAKKIHNGCLPYTW